MTTLRGRSFFSPYFVVKFVKTVSATPRFNIIVSTRVSKRAVERNRIKRIVRDAIRLSLPHFRPGDYVIIVKRQACDKPPLDIKQQLDQLFTKVHLKKV